jgi:hypothetical protein
MQKPIRREELAISPRLAKILINLSGAKKNNLLLDPFCVRLEVFYKKLFYGDIMSSGMILIEKLLIFLFKIYLGYQKNLQLKENIYLKEEMH